jgi:hypothetical protein
MREGNYTSARPKFGIDSLHTPGLRSEMEKQKADATRHASG